MKFCKENEIILTKAHRDIPKFIREMTSRKKMSIIDYFIVNKDLRVRVKHIKVKEGPEIGNGYF